jgi:hypothetical protein
MTTRTENNPVPVCLDPAIGSLLPDYIVNLVEESMAEAVERHLVDCRDCQARYFTVLRFQPEAHKSKPGTNNGHLLNAPTVAETPDVEEVPQS